MTMRGKIKVKRRSGKIDFKKCPQCEKNTLMVTRIFRLNYPYGVYSKPIRSLMLRKKVCLNNICKYKEREVISNDRRRKTSGD